MDVPRSIKKKEYQRKKLLKQRRINPTDELRTRIKSLNMEIKSYYHGKVKHKVRQDIIPGNTKSLWNSVKIAKDISIDPIPKNMFKERNPVNEDSLCNEFAKFFDDKVKNIVESTTIEDGLYKRRRIINSNNKMFMDESSVRECITNLKIKNSEGYDRIPQRIFKEGIEVLLKPLTTLFRLIYEQMNIPEQWKIAKTVPIHKKGPKKTQKITGQQQTSARLLKFMKNKYLNA